MIEPLLISHAEQRAKIRQLEASLSETRLLCQRRLLTMLTDAAKMIALEADNDRLRELVADRVTKQAHANG